MAGGAYCVIGYDYLGARTSADGLGWGTSEYRTFSSCRQKLKRPPNRIKKYTAFIGCTSHQLQTSAAIAIGSKLPTS